MKMVTDNFSSVVARKVEGISDPRLYELPWGPEQRQVRRLHYLVNPNPYYF